MKWKNLPPDICDRGKKQELNPKYEIEAQVLRENRGRWAVLEEYPLSVSRNTVASTVHNITIGRYTAFRPAGDFEVRSYTNHTLAIYEIYIRYTGEVTQPVE